MPKRYDFGTWGTSQYRLGPNELTKFSDEEIIEVIASFGTSGLDLSCSNNSGYAMHKLGLTPESIGQFHQRCEEISEHNYDILVFGECVTASHNIFAKMIADKFGLSAKNMKEIAYMLEGDVMPPDGYVPEGYEHLTNDGRDPDEDLH